MPHAPHDPLAWCDDAITSAVALAGTATALAAACRDASCADAPASVRGLIDTLAAVHERLGDQLSRSRTRPSDEDLPATRLVASCAKALASDAWTLVRLLAAPGDTPGHESALQAAAERCSVGMARLQRAWDAAGDRTPSQPAARAAARAPQWVVFRP